MLVLGVLCWYHLSMNEYSINLMYYNPSFDSDAFTLHEYMTYMTKQILLKEHVSFFQQLQFCSSGWL